MSFDTYEASTALGRPIALYEFRWGTVFWRYTSADTVQTFVDPQTNVGNDFLPISIRDDGMTQGGSSENDFLIHAQSDIRIVSLFSESPPTGSVWVTVRRRHADDPEHEAPVYFVGNVGNVLRTENPAEADIRCISLSKLLSSNGLRLTWSKNCPHCVYDSACRADPAAHEYVAIVKSVAGPVVEWTIPIIPEEGTFTGGFISYDRSGEGTLERRGIEVQQSTTQVKVLGRVPGLTVGMSFKLYPGCDQTTSTCENGFDNLPNNGGFPFMPEKSPFDGTQVFD